MLLLLLANCSPCGSLGGGAAQCKQNIKQCDDIRVTCWRSNAWGATWLQQQRSVVFLSFHCASSTPFLLQSVISEAIHRLSCPDCSATFAARRWQLSALPGSDTPVFCLSNSTPSELCTLHQQQDHCSQNSTPLSLCLLALPLMSPAARHPASC